MLEGLSCTEEPRESGRENGGTHMNWIQKNVYSIYIYIFISDIYNILYICICIVLYVVGEGIITPLQRSIDCLRTVVQSGVRGMV